VLRPDEFDPISVAQSKAKAHRRSRPGRPLLTARLCARLLLGLAGAAAVSFAAPALLAAPKKAARSIAVVVEGEDAESMRGAILAIIPEDLQVIEPEDFERALKKAGARLPLGKGLADKRQRNQVLGRIRKAATTAKASAVVVGIVRKAGAKKEITLLLIDKTPGDLALDDTIPLRGSEADHLRSLDAALGPVLRDLGPQGSEGAKEAKPSPADKKKPSKAGAGAGGGGDGDGDGDDKKDDDKKDDDKKDDDKKDDDKKDDDKKDDEKPTAGARPKNEVRSALFVGELGVEFGARFFGYSDALMGNLRPYNVVGVPLVAIGAELYPLAGLSVPVVNGLGITVSYARALGLSSQTQDSAVAVSTTYQRINVGLRARLPLGDGNDAPLLGLSGGLRLLQFEMETPPALTTELLPSASYTILRLGVDARVPLGPVALLGGLDLLVPLSARGVYQQFQGPAVGGHGAHLGLAIPFMTGLEGRAVLEHTRFFSSFNPEVGDPYVAGGAQDQFFGLRLGAAYVY